MPYFIPFIIIFFISLFLWLIYLGFYVFVFNIKNHLLLYKKITFIQIDKSNG